MIIDVAGVADLYGAAQQLLHVAGSSRVFAFYGEMGVGKTTFIKAICEQLGVTDVTSSPTFAIVNAYASAGGPVYHFDFYRIKSEAEAYDMGYEEYFYSGHHCLVEWPEKITGLLPEGAVKIHLQLRADGHRRIIVERTDR